MFGKKKRIIEVQKALIMDLQQYHNDLVRENARLIKENESMKRIIMQSSESKAFVNIDFPNSEKGGASNTGAVNVSDILNL